MSEFGRLGLGKGSKTTPWQKHGRDPKKDAGIAKRSFEGLDSRMTALEGADSSYSSDTFANRPSASTTNKGLVFKATDVGADGFYYVSTGAAWVAWGPQTIKARSGIITAGVAGAETDLITTTVPANFITQHTQFRIYINGDLDHRATAENTIFRIYIGATVGLTFTLADTANARTNAPWQLQAEARVGNIGAGGNYRMDARVLDTFSGAAPGTSRATPQSTSATIALDTTAQATIRVTSQMVANAANICRAYTGAIEVMNLP